MALQSVSFFLKKFQNLRQNEGNLKEVVKRVILQHLNNKLLDQQISFKKQTIFLKLHPAQKSELFIKRVQIQRALEQELSKVFEVR